MLRVTRVVGDRAHYYLSDLASEIDAVLLAGAASPGADRLRAAGPPAGEWIGGGTRGFGLSGAVDPATFTSFLERRGPSSRPLFPTATAVQAYDLTFTCPKSVSVLFALGDPAMASTVLDAHRSAVRAAMDYVDRRAVTVRRGVDGDRVVLATGGAVGGAFTHGASRALDPHLHTHVVVANLAHGTDGRWSAVDGRGLRAHAPAAGALFDAHLRHELSRRLGVEWDPPSRTRREVIGLDPTVTAGFSLRRAEIRAQLGEWGATSPRASRVAWAVTRQAKASPEERSALAGRWSDRARRLGVTTEDLAAVVGRSLSELGGLDEHRFAATLWDSPHAAPTRRDVVRAWCRALPRGATVGEVEQSVDAWVPPAPELGVAESRQALRGLVPAGYLLRTLGPRPVAARDQQVWLDGARTVDRYRRTWGVTAREEPLGLPDGTAPLARLPARRLADHLAVQRTLDGVAQRLGRTPPSRVREHGRELGFDRG